LTSHFFVDAAYHSLEARWFKIFILAWAAKGFTVDLSNVPDHILDKFMDWAKERGEKEDAELQSRRS
jgi:hypothetical protein